MTDADLLVAAVLKTVRPRAGFEAELAAALARASNQPRVVPSRSERSHTRWVVAGAAVAVSATGAVYWGLKRTRRAA